MKKNFKYDRLAEEIKNVVNEIINDEIETIEFVSVVNVELTKDLGDAKVFIQCLNEKEIGKTINKLEQLNKFIRKRMADRVKMRRVPNLIFKYDNSLNNYNKIEEILKNV